MLTKQDLQNIRGLIREEISTGIETQIRPIIREESKAVVKEELKPIKRKLNRLEKDVRYIIKSFDERLTKTEKAIQKLQNN